MKLLRTTIKRSLIVLVVAIQTLGYSATTSFSRIALADETTAATSEAVVPPAPCPEVSGTNAPTGSSARTFIFNPESCLWENDYYSWNPQTKITTAKYSLSPVYNPTTDAWEHTEWNYSAADGAYKPVLISVPAYSNLSTTNSPSTTGASTGNGAEANSIGSSSITSGNGFGSDNSINSGANLDANIDLSNNASVLTTLDSSATSGDAMVLGNTTVGNVATGDAATFANILNMIQSSWNPANGDFNLFSANLYNDYFGDLLFDPSIVLGNGSSSINNIDATGNQDLTINVSDNADIQNDINLNAQSGNADANANTTVGNVSTGDATALANVINMINSIITAGKSFIGSINLHGDLNGDILLPKALMEILLGNGTGASNTITGNSDANIDANSSTNSSITNNTDLAASSGNTVADANTTVGDISTGNAQTSVKEINLVGQNVQGTKGLLVFVNVLGSWIGMLFGAPGNASIMGGNGSNSTNNISNNASLDADINTNSDYKIENNLNLNAASGDATASANTTVGNVSTGKASSGVNLLNMINSSMNFTDWFGVLFINVFGNWTGSFGVNTGAGNPAPATGGMGGGQQTAANSSEANAATGPPQALGFVARNFASAATAAAATTATSSTSTTAPDVLAKNTNNTATEGTQPAKQSNTWRWTFISVTLACAALGLERFLALRRHS